MLLALCSPEVRSASDLPECGLHIGLHLEFVLWQLWYDVVLFDAYVLWDAKTHYISWVLPLWCFRAWSAPVFFISYGTPSAGKLSLVGQEDNTCVRVRHPQSLTLANSCIIYQSLFPLSHRYMKFDGPLIVDPRKIARQYLGLCSHCSAPGTPNKWVGLWTWAWISKTMSVSFEICEGVVPLLQFHETGDYLMISRSGHGIGSLLVCGWKPIPCTLQWRQPPLPVTHKGNGTV